MKIIRASKKDYYNNYREVNREKSIQYSKKYNSDNKEVLTKKAKERITPEVLQKKKEYLYKYWRINIITLSEKRKIYNETVKDKIRDYQKKYRDAHKLKRAKYQNEYVKKRKKENVLFLLRLRYSDLIKKSLKAKNCVKSSKTSILLGCEYEYFKKHIELKFTEGMSWSNYGKWHLDHIFPNALCNTEELIIKNQHYTNFQPLWAKDNILKGKKLTKDL
jgi:hypothetical protein